MTPPSLCIHRLSKETTCLAARSGWRGFYLYAGGLTERSGHLSGMNALIKRYEKVHKTLKAVS